MGFWKKYLAEPLGLSNLRRAFQDRYYAHMEEVRAELREALTLETSCDRLTSDLGIREPPARGINPFYVFDEQDPYLFTQS